MHGRGFERGPAPQAMNISNIARSNVAANVWEQTSSGVKTVALLIKPEKMVYIAVADRHAFGPSR